MSSAEGAEGGVMRGGVGDLWKIFDLFDMGTVHFGGYNLKSHTRFTTSHYRHMTSFSACLTQKIKLSDGRRCT
jgi:hypothetical protein